MGAVSREGRLTGYPEIGRAAYGSFGYYTVQFFHKTTLLGVCTIFLILAGLNFADVLEPSTGLDARAWYDGRCVRAPHAPAFRRAHTLWTRALRRGQDAHHGRGRVGPDGRLQEHARDQHYEVRMFDAAIGGTGRGARGR